jgi:RHS repeat-associated protein
VYKPFGEADVNPNSSVVNNFRFPGQYYDQETGLHYNYHRYYDPSPGRYLTADPIGLYGGINLYTYVLNNPVNYIDPLGLIRYNAPPPRTVPLEGSTQNSLQCLERCLQNRTRNQNLDILVTGGAEQSGHSRNSRHYTGEACDIAGPRHNPVNDAEVSECARDCGFGSTTFEPFPNNPNRDHWHLEMPRNNNR